MFLDVAWEPIVGAMHGFFDLFFILAINGLIEGHMNICADLPLSLHRNLGVHADFVAVDMRLESDAVVVDFGVFQGKHLETAGIGKSWTMPAGKFGEAASLFNELWAGGENKMVSVCKNSLAAKFAHLGVSDGFDTSTSGGANKGGRLNIAVRSVNNAGAHETVLLDNFKF